MKQVEGLQGEDGVGTVKAAFRAPEGGGIHARPLTLPPDTSFEKFSDFMKKIAEIVGEDNVTVISSEAELQHDDYLDPSKTHDVGCFSIRTPQRILTAVA